MEQTNFADILQKSFIAMSMGGTERITTINVVTNIMISFLVGMFIYYMYKKTYQGVLYQKSFNVSLVLASVVTSLIIMTISGNLILSLGMVGALSIVRFRTPIKDSMDLIFLFWAISVGIANGVGYYNLSITGSLLIALILLFLTWKKEDGRAWLLVCRSGQANSEQPIQHQCENILLEECDRFILKSKVFTNQTLELVYEIRTNSSNENHQMISKINAIENIMSTSLVSYEDGMNNI